MVGPGAYALAKEHRIEIVDPDSLIVERARRDWRKWKSRLRKETEGGHEGPEERKTSVETIMQDTVGSVACDDFGHMSAGVSRLDLLPYNGRNPLYQFKQWRNNFETARKNGRGENELF